MNSLNSAVKAAIAVQGSQKEANKAYIEFIKANFIVPIEQKSAENDEPKVLFLQEGNTILLPVFTEMVFLDAWAMEISQNIKLLRLSGVDLLKGIGDNVTVCLDIGSDAYKEFNPSEIARMKSTVLKFFQE
jgi:hypothetical protein